MADDELTQFKKKNFWKFFLIMLFISLAFIAIISQLIKIQLVDRSIYEAKAKKQHESAGRGGRPTSEVKSETNSSQELPISIYTGAGFE